MKNKTNQQVMKRFVAESDDTVLATVRGMLLQLADEYLAEGFGEDFSPNSIIHPNLYINTGYEIKKYLEFED